VYSIHLRKVIVLDSPSNWSEHFL